MIMSKKTGFIVLMLTGLLTSSCVAKKTELQKAIGLTNKMSNLVEKIFTYHNVAYETVNVSENPIVEGMDTNWQAFDLINEDGDTYVIVLRKSQNGKTHDDFSALLDSEGRLIEGMVSDDVLPALFENGKYKFD